jgi:hypothetical protein
MPDSEFLEPTTDDIAAVVAAFQPLLAPGASLGTYGGGEELADGTYEMPWFHFSDELAEFHDALYAHRIVCAYGEEGWGRRMEAFRSHPELLGCEDLHTIRKVLTTVIRNERYCDGYIQGMFDVGLVQAAVARLGDLGRQLAERGAEPA